MLQRAMLAGLAAASLAITALVTTTPVSATTSEQSYQCTRGDVCMYRGKNRTEKDPWIGRGEDWWDRSNPYSPTRSVFNNGYWDVEPGVTVYFYYYETNGNYKESSVCLNPGGWTNLQPTERDRGVSVYRVDWHGAC
ncbi:hypothetical protein [Microtetraspora malaysiensis]|uniref:hypothetical protein n=1 Tax=Microtetraspora malaysiensis TaxID=161358 RepID=UPI003D8D476C